jgi:hypothetical protein
MMTTTEALTREDAIRQAMADLEPRGSVTGWEVAARVAELGHAEVTMEEIDTVVTRMIREGRIKARRSLMLVPPMTGSKALEPAEDEGARLDDILGRLQTRLSDHAREHPLDNAYTRWRQRHPDLWPLKAVAVSSADLERIGRELFEEEVAAGRMRRVTDPETGETIDYEVVKERP